MDQYTKIFRVLVMVILVTSLIVNVSLLSKFDALNNQVNYLSNNQQNIMSTINGQTSHIQNVLSDIQKEQSWISSINMDVNREELLDGDMTATFEWQIKELHQGSEVVFNYVYGDSEEYISLPATEIQQGLFQVTVPIDVEIKPQWEVGLVTNMEKETSKQKVEEKMEREARSQTLKYFVSVSYDEMSKNSEIHSEHLGYIGTGDYGIIQVDIGSFDGKLNVNVTNHRVNDSSSLLEEVYLQKYEGDTLVGEEKVEKDDENNPPDDRVRFFHLNQVEVEKGMRLVLKVIYSDGATFEKEVY